MLDSCRRIVSLKTDLKVFSLTIDNDAPVSSSIWRSWPLTLGVTVISLILGDSGKMVYRSADNELDNDELGTTSTICVHPDF